jgi:hypothetical protein
MGTEKAVARLSGAFHILYLFIRMLLMLLAGHTTIGWAPRKSIVRHSRSMGEWNPLITVMQVSLKICDLS